MVQRGPGGFFKAGIRNYRIEGMAGGDTELRSAGGTSMPWVEINIVEKEGLRH